MSVALIVFTDGRRDCLDRTLASAREALPWDEFAVRHVVDDSGDPAASHRLVDDHPDMSVSPPVTGRKRGFAGAIAAGWGYLQQVHPTVDWVFHLEDDFVFNRPVDLGGMIDVLDVRPHIAQMALRRQAWNDEERAAGGIVEQFPDDYTDHCAGSAEWMEHRRFFTTNPCVYRSSLTRGGWPLVPHSEGVFSCRLFADPAVTSAFWGRRSSAPWVHHIGVERTGVGY